MRGKKKMLKTIRRLTIGATVVGSVSAIASAPAFAASLSVTSLTGNFFIYDSDGVHTTLTPYTGLDQAQRILEGSAGSPTGNIELFADSETSKYSNLNNFQNAAVTTLTGTIHGKQLSLSSLTGKDWFGELMDKAYYATGAANSTLAAKWFNAVLDANGFIGSSRAGLFNTFLTNGGFQRFSDANISYVNQANPTSKVLIGLGGHYDATNLLVDVFTGNSKNSFVRAAALSSINSQRSAEKRGTAIQASEVFKVAFGGRTDYKYNFSATNSGLIATDDGISHNGNYEITVEPVPEPTTILGMIVGLGGIFAAKRQQKKAQA